MEENGRASGLLNQTGFDRLDGDPDPLRAAVGGLDTDPLKIGTELALRDTRHVCADAAALLRLTLTIDDRALGRTATGDCTDSGHDGFELVKGSKVEVASRVKQGDFVATLSRHGPNASHAKLGTSGPFERDARAGATRAYAG